MTDLNKKQAFWAEQLPLFKEKYWLPEHLDVLEFNMDGGCFEIPIDVKTDLSEDDLFDIYHRVNSGWAMWKKAVTFMKEKAKAQGVPEGYVLLPRVPTEKMFQAYERYSVAPMSTLSKTGYKAMVEAAGDQNESS
ncbi:hypothetical protein [Acinetobacter baumannii]|uniref:hypothetical protein n=1 Tax=Acinetobacter baumannii TaxID=470 RepID=UPI0002BBDD36|nr:hypothetical protein [Acinetobacter baumannii]